jgi:hypothetical protein
MRLRREVSRPNTPSSEWREDAIRQVSRNNQIHPKRINACMRWMDRQKRVEWTELVDCDPGKVCEANQVTESIGQEWASHRAA